MQWEPTSYMSDKFKSIFDDIVGIKNENPVGVLTPLETRKNLYYDVFGEDYPQDTRPVTAKTVADLKMENIAVEAHTLPQWTTTPHVSSVSVSDTTGPSSFLDELPDTAMWNTPVPDGFDYDVRTWTVTDQISYKFNEDIYLKEAKDHIDGTYSGHYGKDGLQATEVIIDSGHGTGFNTGNMIKYAKRYGKKNGYNRQDLLKIIHYAVMQLYVHDKDKLGN